MDIQDVLIQGLSIIAMSLVVLSFQQKSQKLIIVFQLCGSLLFSVHFGLLGSLMGCLLNAINVVRAAIFSNKKRFNTDRWIYTVGLLTVYTLAYVLTFTLFGTEPTPKNFIVEGFPLVSSFFMTFAFRARTARGTRILGFFNSPGWLIYNIFNFSIGGILCEIFCMISVILGIVRYDILKKTDKAAAAEEASSEA